MIKLTFINRYLMQRNEMQYMQLTAIHANKIVGVMEYAILRDLIYVMWLAVPATWQRQGIATALSREVRRLNPGKDILADGSTREGKLYMAGRRLNPKDEYDFRQYTVEEDGSLLFVARIHLELYATRKSVIFEYLERLMKRPGLTLGKEERLTDTLSLKTEFGNIRFSDYDFRIDADSNRYFVRNEDIDNYLEEMDLSYRINDKTVLAGTRTTEGYNWRGANTRLEITVTSRDMNHLTNYMNTVWPTASNWTSDRPYLRGKQKRRPVLMDYGVKLWLDTPRPEGW